MAAGTEVIAHLEANTDVPFRPYPAQPDYRQELPGAAPGRRPLEPLAFDGRLLGRHFAEVGCPLPELMLFRGMMVTRGEAARLLRFDRSLDSLLLGARLVGRYALDRLRDQRGTRLVLGNALVARLYHNALQRGVQVWLRSTPTRLTRENGRVTGVTVEHEGSERIVRADKAVIKAGGGFPASPELRERYLPEPVARYTSAFPGCTGDTHRIAREIGATLGPPGYDNALWFPGSIATRADGSTAVYPHIVLDRGKPGMVAVNAAGRRFVDEAVSYHGFTRAMYRAHKEVPTIPAWLVCDRRFVARYGLGMIRPARLPGAALPRRPRSHRSPEREVQARRDAARLQYPPA